MKPHTKAAVLFEHRPRFRVTETAIRFDGRSFAAIEIAAVTASSSSVSAAQAGGLGVLVVAGGLGALWAGLVQAVPLFVLLLAGVGVLWLRGQGHTIVLTTHSGQQLEYTTPDAELAAGIARGVRRAIASCEQAR